MVDHHCIKNHKNGYSDMVFPPQINSKAVYFFNQFNLWKDLILIADENDSHRIAFYCCDRIDDFWTFDDSVRDIDAYKGANILSTFYPRFK